MTWTHEDKPEDHPLWEQQVELERGMMKSGGDAFRDRVILAEKKGQLTKINVARGLLQDWLPGVAKNITGWVKDVDKTRGTRPIAFPYIKDVDPYAAGLVALRCVLDGLSKSQRSLTGIAMEIGRTTEHEQRIRYWEKTEPELFYSYQHEMDKNHATSTHRRRVNINRFNKLLERGETELQWEPWTQEVIFRVGIALLDVIIRTTGWFEVVPDPMYTSRHNKFKQKLVVVAKAEFAAWWGRSLDHVEVCSPQYRPTIMPPRRWSSTRDGGYWTPYVQAPRLVRFKASQESQKARAADEYDAFDMEKEFEAIHLLQETRWRINQRVFDVAYAAHTRGLTIAGMPELRDRELPTRTPRILQHAEAAKEWRAAGNTEPVALDEETTKELRSWKRKASPIHRFNAKRFSVAEATKTTMLVAIQYRHYDAFYFPHMLDFRGRKYPIPNFLQPQGSDLARGLLTFADGLPIADEGDAGWLAVQLASSWGKDKLPFEDRIKWVEENEELWRRIAADPMANQEWSVTEEGPNKVDKPWQSLAAVFDWVGFLDEGYGYVSHLPIMADGTCNGIQHLSALTRDKLAGSYVNLVPSNRPRDIYKFVADELQERIERIAAAGGAEGEKADYWLELCDNDLPRSLTKRQVMVLPYGGSKDSFFTYTRAWLDKADIVPEYVADLADEDAKAYFETRTKRITFLALHLWDCVNHVVSGGMKVMKWLQDCAKVAAIDNQPIYWITPTGFIVRHFYGTERAFLCETKLDGERFRLTRTERTAKLSVKDQLQGISPNFIHSLDASALTECLAMCREEGVKAFASVHDAYGTHAANMWPLSRMLRQAFVNIHATDILGNFRNACASVIVSSLVLKGHDVFEASQKADDMLPRPMALGELDLSDVLKSDYFFA